MTDLGVVTIGRNEGERLRVGLRALERLGVPVVYVDSRSTDGSPELARALGAEVVVLDLSRPIGVPRARNEGFERLLELHPEIRYVQFVDGDCELREGWLEQGRAVLDQRPDVALVTGRRRERFPERSVYNRLADLEWDMPIGEIDGSHGDVMIRALAFRQVGGFDANVLVAEDIDICLRLRQRGWILLRLDQEMTIHNMDMTRFGQWWRRAVRAGYGYADGAYLHGGPPERRFVREVLRILGWGLLIPLAILLLAWPTRGASLALTLVYPLQYWRIERRARLRRGWTSSDARIYALFCVLGHFPHLVGLVTYWFRLIGRRPKKIIEYKAVGNATAAGDGDSIGQARS